VAEKSKKDYRANLEGMETPDLLELIESALLRLPIENIDAIIQTAQECQRTKRQEAKENLITEIREKAAKAGIPIHELFASASPAASRRRGTGTHQKVKYRSPNGETWSGRGKSPKWLQTLETEGRKREEFRVQEQPAGQPA